MYVMVMMDPNNKVLISYSQVEIQITDYGGLPTLKAESSMGRLFKSISRYLPLL